MNYFMDAEFLEDGSTIDLISIAVVADDGREYYAISNEFNTRRVAESDWLMQNVMSSIPHDSMQDWLGQYPPIISLHRNDNVKSRAQIAQDIEEFFVGDAELWADYGAYDHVALAQLWGPMVNLPANVPMYTNDIRTLVRLVERVYPHLNGELPRQGSGMHNALDDARYNRSLYRYLNGLFRIEGL